jgi:uncharacterized repeat protein (TIGR04138 family)
MSITSKRAPRTRYHANAYRFVSAALPYAQKLLNRNFAANLDDESAHITGPELLEGIRRFALENFGLLTLTVFHRWGIRETKDFGRIVFELIERGELRKTDRDHISDFYAVYDFEDVFNREYRINTHAAFEKK